jgi:tetratricopeptide (TPR) repeat protein
MGGGLPTPLITLIALLAGPIADGTASPARPGPEAFTPPEPREIPVVFALPRALRTEVPWRRELDRALSEANLVLGPHLRARFALSGIVDWPALDGSLEALLDTLRAQAPPSMGRIVAGMVERGPREPAAGLASYRDGLLVVAVPGPGRGGSRLFVHELAHLFGAVHHSGPGGLMAPDAPDLELDELNARLIGLHRNRRLAPHRFPLPARDLEAAASLYREAVPEAPFEAGLHLAQLALEEGRPTVALEAARRALAAAAAPADPGIAEAHNLRGIALRRLGRPREASAAYEEALARRPTRAAYHYNLAIALDRLGEMPRSVAANERAVELDPTHVSALANLARLLARGGEPGRAAAYARQALRIAPDFTEARVNLALALLESDEHQAAEDEARLAVAEKPHLAPAHEVLGGVLLAAGRPREAATCFERAGALEPGEPRFRQQRAAALLGLGRQLRVGRDAAALATLEHAVALDPENADAISELAEVRFERGLAGPATETYRKLLTMRPDDATAHNNLAVLLFRSGDLEGARRHVNEARRLGLAVHPEFLEALDATESR